MTQCTGIAASWCPVCGDCKCARRPDGERIEDDPKSELCPLHGTASKHGDEMEHPQTDLLAFCPVCGPLHMEDDADGRAVSPIDEDGCCRFCGADTCFWDQLVEMLGAAGFTLGARP